MTADGPTPAHADLVGSVLSGKYTLRRLVGRGGMGAVYEAFASDAKLVAVKVLRVAQTEGAKARFLREGKIASRFEHPHLVPVLEVGEDVDRHLPYLVMPFLEGRDLAAVLDAAPRLRPVVAARIAFQACQGLAFVHSKDVVHRDIKPSNVFLENDGGGELTVRLCDFGIAKMTGASELTQLTSTGAVLGTPLYMAPESMTGEPDVDPRRDVYGIGALLYEMLSGSAAWSGHADEGFASLAIRIASQDVPALAERAPWVEAGLAALVHRAMARDPASRPKDARELMALLRPFCGDDIRLTDDMLAAFTPAAPDEGTVTEAPTAIDIDPLVGTRIDDRYELVRLIGRGGMGSVYDAEVADGSHVAVKLISSEIARTETRTVERFLREAGAVRSIASPNVVKILAAGTDRALGSPFIVMELLDGIDLGTCLRDRGAMEVGPTLAVFVQAARGIQAAHERGITHRDIKPANLFLQVDELGAITVKVCDFGIAKQAPSETDEIVSLGLTATGGMLGSPRYMSPEQAQDAKRVDHRSDVWSFCVSLYETLSGRKAWEECSSLGEIIVAICTRPMNPLREVAPWVEPSLAAIVHRGLAIDAAERWESMSALGDALTDALRQNGGDPAGQVTLDQLRRVERRDATTGPRAKVRHTGRRPRLWLAALVASGVMGGAVVVYFTQRSFQGRELSNARVSTVESGSAAAAPEPEKAARHALVVSPGDAVVTVDGKVVGSPAGLVELEGRPGDSFAVVAVAGSAQKAARIFVTSDHQLEPPRIVVEAATSPMPSARRAAAPATGHVPTQPAPTSGASALPAPPSPSGALKPRENW